MIFKVYLEYVDVLSLFFLDVFVLQEIRANSQRRGVA